VCKRKIVHVTLHDDAQVEATVRAFYQAAQTYYPLEKSIEEGLAVIETGIAFLQSVKAWWLEYEHSLNKY